MAELVQEVLIAAQPSTIFQLLTDPAQVAWWGTNAELDPRPGGIYKILVGDNHPSRGEFVEVVTNEKIVFTFGWDQPGHPIPAGSTMVAITLTPEGESTRVRLVHSGLPDDAIADHNKGWVQFLEALKTEALAVPSRS
ncbi:MAG: SRPBCC family protein [Acidimicrobiales bacterium]